MKNINKLNSTYTYPAKGKGQSAIEVGFYTEARVDRYGNPLRKINVLDIYGQIHSVDYCGKTLILSVKTGLRTTSVRRAKREDLEKYKEAYSSYLDTLTIEEKKEHLTNIYSLLGELPSKEEKAELEVKKAAEEKEKEERNKALQEANAEIERLRAQLEAKSKAQKPKSVKNKETSNEENEENEKIITE